MRRPAMMHCSGNFRIIGPEKGRLQPTLSGVPITGLTLRVNPFCCLPSFTAALETDLSSYEKTITGRTSIEPKRAPGIFAAIFAASLMSFASTR